MKRLADCGDTLTVTEICQVLQISRTHYYDLKRHRAFPIKPIKGLGVTRYLKAAVEHFFTSAVSGPALVWAARHSGAARGASADLGHVSTPSIARRRVAGQS